MIDNVVVGKTISKLRQNKNMTQQQLAAALNVSHQAVSKWETGAALPDVQMLMALTRFFGITMEQLLSGDVPEDRVEAQKASPFDEPIQNLSNIVNNLVNGIFRPAEKKQPAEEAEADEEEREAEAVEPEDEERAEGDESAETFDVQQLLQMAPFMSRAAVDEMLMNNRERLSLADIARLAPFASQGCLEKLVLASCEDITWDVLRRLAPFLKRDMVDKLAKAAAQKPVEKTPEGDDVGVTMQEMGQKIGSGVEKAIRRAAKLSEDVAAEVSGAINGIMGDVKAREARAQSLRNAACRRALKDEKWEWLAEHIEEIEDDDLLKEIAQRANALGMHDWVLEHLNGYADTRTIEAAIEAGNWGWLGDHVWQFEDELQEKIALAAAQQENWQWLSTYAEQISLEHCADKIGIAAYSAQARVLALQIAERCMNKAQREALADAVVAGEDWPYLEQLSEHLTPEYFGRLCAAAASEGQWEQVKRFADKCDADSVAGLMEQAIEAGNFEIIDLLNPML